jgi:salicylate hydroxylase
MGPLLEAKGSMVDKGFQVYNLDGELQMKVPLSTKSKYGAERILLHRVDLHEALKHRATSSDYPGKPASIKVSSRIVDASECDQGKVVLASGEVLTADLIVGADGIKSVVRPGVVGKNVSVLPTGHSAYRMVFPIEDLVSHEDFKTTIDPRESVTTMVMGHDCRLIMGPARNSSIYSVVAMVPDEKMNETSADSSWNTSGDLDKMLKTFEQFPAWAKVPLQVAKEAGLWQLRDIDPLSTWYKGRAILIGDSAHAMLPTQGQGASQSVEDAEALGAFFENVEDGEISRREVEAINRRVFQCRFDRASTIQAYSRQTAKPATSEGSAKIKMSPVEFMDYNCNYAGAVEWEARQKSVSEEQEKLPSLVQELKVGA